MNNVKPDGAWDWTKRRFVPATARQIERYSLQLGDVLFNSTNSAEQVGKSALYKKHVESVVCFSNHFIRLRTDSEKLAPEYLVHFLGWLWGRRVFENMVNSWVNQATVRREDLLDLGIPLPPLTEQKRIAAILDKIDAARLKRQQTMQLVDDFLKSVFLDMFGDPVVNSKGWEMKSIKEMAVVTTGNTPPRGDVDNYGDFIEWIKSDNINTPSDFLTVAAESLSEAGYMIGRHVAAGSTLLTCIAGSFECIGNVAYVDRLVAFNQQINALTPKVGVNEVFLYSLAKYCKKIIQAASTGGMKGMVSKGKLESVRLICPPENLQRKFAEVFCGCQSLRKGMERSASEISEGLSSIKQRAFSG
nr:restriction endonuclease subunit S [Pseudomonas gingeri]